MSKYVMLVASLFAATAAASPPTLFESAAAPKRGTAERRVDVDDSALAKAVAEGGLWIQLPGENPVFARSTRYDLLQDGNVSWAGKANVDGTDHTVVVTAGRDALFATLVAADGSQRVVETRHGTTYVIARKPQLDARHSPLLRRMPDYIEGAPVVITGRDEARTAQALALATAPVVDVFVGYSPGMVTRYGSTAAAVTRINFLVATTNTAFQDSQVDASLRLVGTLQVNYSETATNSATLAALGDTSGLGPLQALRDARRSSGADMLAMVRPFLTPEHGNCGLATLNGSNLRPYTTAAAGGARAAVSDGTDDNSGYYCGNTTFAHELGHNWGLVHDSANSSSPGPYAYTYGWRQSEPDGGFYTLMAYGASGQSEAPYYSNPDIFLCKGQPCGSSGSADQARALRQVLPVAAAFNQPLDPLIDFNADGNADVLYQNDGQLTYVLYESGRTAGSLQQTQGAGYRLAASGDFNGDHRTDLAWVNAAGTSLVLWLVRIDGGFDPQPASSHSGNWIVVAAADVSRDGKSDLLWINKSTNQMRYWVMNGNSVTSVKTFSITPGYFIAAARDFNADGRVDLMWTGADRKLEYWQNNGSNTFSIVTSPLQYGSELRLVGSGDFDNDERADLVFFNDSALLLSPASVWLMDGANRIGTKSVPGPVLALLHSPIAVDRYSGGTASVLWSSPLRDLYLSQNDGSGDNYELKSLLVWPAGGNSYYSTYPAAWTLFSGNPRVP